jgi:hypothetical protein
MSPHVDNGMRDLAMVIVSAFLQLAVMERAQGPVESQPQVSLGQTELVDKNERVITAQVLPTFAAAGNADITEGRLDTWRAAMEWQKIGAEAQFWEMSANVHGQVAHGHLYACAGRAAAAGEQLGLACTASLEANRWLEREPDGGRTGMAARAMSEMTTYYALSAAHGLVNIAARFLHLDASKADANLSKTYQVAVSEDPFADSKAAWLSFNASTITALESDITIQRRPILKPLGTVLRALVEDPDWLAATERRHTEYHRWRPQSVAGGATPSNPWNLSTPGLAHLQIELPSGAKPDAVALVKESDRALDLLTTAMTDWLIAWQKVLVNDRILRFN